MCTVLLADDEYYILSGLTELIEKNFPQMCVHGFSSGEAALEALSQLRPDIIISDIRMGEFSGLDFIAGVRKLYPEIQILIISGYNDFEYARRAIELGVKRYLLKPIRHKQLLEALGEMEKNVKADEEERRRRAFSRDAARQSVMADALVSGVVDARMKLQMRLAGLMHLLEEYCVGCLNVFEYQQAAPYDHANQFIKLRRYIADRVSQEMGMLGTCEFVFVDGIRGNLVLIAGCGVDSCAKVLQAISQELRAEFWRHSEVGVSALHHGEDELFIAYCQAQGVCSAGNAFSLFDDTELALLRQAQAIKKQMADALAKDTPAQVGAKLRMAVEAMRRDYDRNALAVSCLAELMESVRRFYLEQARQEQNSDEIPQTDIMGFELSCLSQLLPHAQALEQALCKYHESRMRRKAAALVAQTKRYIDENMANATQESIAAHMKISAIYLSVLFKEETGESFRDYLIASKIERAKQLLAQTDQRVYEIAVAVGYSDIKYFSRNFKRLVGCLPNAYRTRMRAKQPSDGGE